MPTDTEMIDWLESRRTDYGKGIIFRYSPTGRGWWFHETDLCDAQPNVRRAIAAAMLAEGAQEKPDEQG